jgi:hypothetical protein
MPTSKRKNVPKRIETLVLTKCRRKCCLCFWLAGDVSENLQGQIAHIDGNSFNNSEANLVYLCLAHHDLYDSRTSQSKGLTDTELRHYRDNLYALLEDPLTLGIPSQEPQGRKRAVGSQTAGFDPRNVFLAKLPNRTSPFLCGRSRELAELTRSLENPGAHVVALVAFGGVGKTALVKKWLLDIRDTGYGGVERVYGHSFYSQGAAENKQTSCDGFLDHALAWFGDPASSGDSSWDKAQRLLRLLGRRRTLLILDGLEPLQHAPRRSRQGGEIKDPALQSLICGLARHMSGLCVITTRIEIPELKEYQGAGFEQLDLENLSRTAGAELLLKQGVKGSVSELCEVSDDFGGHALALTLLGSYLRIVYHGDPTKRDRIRSLMHESHQGGHARRVMEAYERWFTNQPELDVLRMLGLFDRPADGGAIRALLAAPSIPYLTDKASILSPEAWHVALANLRLTNLVAEVDDDSSDTLDCHPLVREHFRDKVQQEVPDAWKTGNIRLYEYLRGRVQYFPETGEELDILLAAVSHGCAAGHHQQALNEVYWKRILRQDENLSRRLHGSSMADLAALSNFFKTMWTEPIGQLVNPGFVVMQAALHLRTLGRCEEGSEASAAALELSIKEGDFVHASMAAGSLSQICLNTGRLTECLSYARQGIEHAAQSGDLYQQMCRWTTLGDALHHLGRTGEAILQFDEANRVQQQLDSENPYLGSIWGYRYRDLLLRFGDHQEVLRQAESTLAWALRSNRQLDIAVDRLSLARAGLCRSKEIGDQDVSRAITLCSQAVEGLFRIAFQEMIIRALLVRIELHLLAGDCEKAQGDLATARGIAQRRRMTLHEADCLLWECRVLLATGQRAGAKAALAAATALIESMGYKRRAEELESLERLLGPSR